MPLEVPNYIAQHPRYESAAYCVDTLLKGSIDYLYAFESLYPSFFYAFHPRLDKLVSKYGADVLREPPRGDIHDMRDTLKRAYMDPIFVEGMFHLQKLVGRIPPAAALFHYHGKLIDFMSGNVYARALELEPFRNSGELTATHYLTVTGLEFYSPERMLLPLDLRQEHTTINGSHDYDELLIGKDKSGSLRDIVRMLRNTIPENLFTPLIRQLNIYDIVSKQAHKTITAAGKPFTREHFLHYLSNLAHNTDLAHHTKNIGDEEIAKLFKESSQLLEQKLLERADLTNGDLVHFGKTFSYREYAHKLITDPDARLYKPKDIYANQMDMWGIPGAFNESRPLREQVKNIQKRQLFIEEGKKYLAPRKDSPDTSLVQFSRYLAELDYLTFTDARLVLIHQLLNISTVSDIERFFTTFSKLDSVFYSGREIAY